MFRPSSFMILSCLFVAQIFGLTIKSDSRRRLFTLLKSSKLSDQNIAEISGIYIHIPYCRRRCSYCDFAIVPIGDVTRNDVVKGGFLSMDETYRRAVLDEIEILKRCQEKKKTPKHQIKSIYFGGGTPSLAPTETIQAILSRLIEIFDIPKQNVEITMEMDPGTFTLSQLELLKRIGINRISLGVQSFNDTILEGIGRVHRECDIMNSMSTILSVYGKEANVSIDLISGLPGLTTEIWRDTLDRVLDLNPLPKHLSVYDLQIEEGTAFGRWYTDEDEVDGRTSRITPRTELNINPRNKLRLPTAEECATMYRYASRMLRKSGFEHYEISSYARLSSSASKLGARSEHNQLYWNIGSDWYALGLSSTSSFNGFRFARPRQMSDYLSWVSEVQDSLERKDDWKAPWLRNDVTEAYEDELLQDIIMTRLRTKEGLDLNMLDRMFSLPKHEKLVTSILKGAEDGIKLGLAVHTNTNEKNELRLCDPEGFLFSNTIISSIFSELP